MNDTISTAPETRGMGDATERQRFSRLLIIEDDAAQLHTLMRISNSRKVLNPSNHANSPVGFS